MKLKELNVKIVWGGYFFLSSIFLVLIFSVGIISQALIFFGFTVSAMLLNQRNGITHPLSWFSIFFLMYSISYPLYHMEVYGADAEVALVIPLCFASFISFALAVMLIARRSGNVPQFSMPAGLLTTAGYVLIFICVLIIFYIFRSGATSKREVMDSIQGGWIERAFLFFYMLNILYILRLSSIYFANGKVILIRDFFDFFGVCVFAVFFIGYGVSGERDLVFRFLFIVMLLFFIFKYTYKSYYLMGAVLLLTLLLPLSQAAKAYMLSGQIDYDGYTAGDFFNTEFSAAGKNIYYVISREVTGYAGETLVWDLKRFLSFIYPEQQGTGAWFNEHIRYVFGDHGTSGWGFSLVAEGYVNFGFFGGPVIMFFIGCISAILYRISFLNTFLWIFYMFYIPALVYVIRADVANYLSLVFKVNVVLLCAVSIYLFFSKAFLVGIKNSLRFERKDYL